MEYTRRNLLRFGSIVALGGLAGCDGADDPGNDTATDGESTPTAEPTATETATETPTETATDADTETPTETECETETVSGEIATDTTWGGDCETVRLTERVDVVDAATLTVEPGTTVVAQKGTALNVDSGALKAVGTASEPIRFRGASDIPGYWHGVVVGSNAPNELAHVTVANAGYADTEPALDVLGRLSITETTVEQSGGYGARIDEDASIPSFSANAFRDNENAGLLIDAVRVGDIDAESTYADGNGADYIQIRGDQIDEETTWPAPDAPYYFGPDSGGLAVDGGLVIEAGARLVFGEGKRLLVETGYLDARGTAENPVVFEAELESPGYWRGIWVNSKNPKNSLANARVAYAHDGAYVDGGHLSITDTVFERNDSVGVYVDDGTIPEFARNEFANNGEVPIRLPADLVGSLDGESTYAGDNGHDRIEVHDEDVESEQTWPATDAPILLPTIEVHDELAVDPGADFMFRKGARLTVTDEDGKLVVNGGEDAPVTFRGQNAAPGYWTGIVVESADSGNEIDNADIGYARTGVAVQDKAQMTVSNSAIHDVTRYGLFVDSEGYLTDSNNTFRNIGEKDVRRG